eukprot:10653656-Lingulodinium_polyedra.AAC.1
MERPAMTLRRGAAAGIVAPRSSTALSAARGDGAARYVRRERPGRAGPPEETVIHAVFWMSR